MDTSSEIIPGTVLSENADSCFRELELSIQRSCLLLHCPDLTFM